MSKRGPTKREHDAQLNALRDPLPMSLEEALASEDPVAEIGLRLMNKATERMSEPEKVFWAVAYFVGDTLNGGLVQTMTNSSGDFIEVVEEFAKRYGPPELLEIVAGVNAFFPGGHAPQDRDERIDVVAPLIEKEVDPFDPLTLRFYQCEGEIRKALLALVQRNRDAFNLEASIDD